MKSYGRVILYLNSACQERAFQGFIVDIRNLVSKEHARVNTTPNWLSNYQLALSLSKSQNYDVNLISLLSTRWSSNIKKLARCGGPCA